MLLLCRPVQFTPMRQALDANINPDDASVATPLVLMAAGGRLMTRVELAVKKVVLLLGVAQLPPLAEVFVVFAKSSLQALGRLAVATTVLPAEPKLLIGDKLVALTVPLVSVNKPYCEKEPRLVLIATAA